MKTDIFLPEKIKVGFQARRDTYTKKLAFITYYDAKGVLRKEQSWEGWRNKGISAEEFKNVPTEGFVLNKKAGGNSSGWNQRQTYVRIYDPRGFELEISITNLLYILENTNSIKGKGLEGEFVYGWSGTELILIPTSAPDYRELSKFNEELFEKKVFKGKDLILGATYKTKKNEHIIYLGHYDYYKEVDYRASYFRKSKGKHYIFQNGDNNYEILKTLSDKLIGVVSNDCAENVAELVERLEKRPSISSHDRRKTKFLPYSFEEFKEEFKKRGILLFFNQKKEVYILENSRNGKGTVIRAADQSYQENKIAIKECFEKMNPYFIKTYLPDGSVHKENSTYY